MDEIASDERLVFLYVWDSINIEQQNMIGRESFGQNLDETAIIAKLMFVYCLTCLIEFIQASIFKFWNVGCNSLV